MHTSYTASTRWETGNLPTQLDDDTIHVWRAWLNQPTEQVSALAETLAPDEHARAAGFYFERDCTKFIVSRGILRYLLGSYLGCIPSDVCFSYTSQGKPVLENKHAPGHISFSLSHSHQLVLYAFTIERAVGIDVEHVRPVDRQEQIVQRYFSPREQRVYFALPAEQRTTAFFNAWTYKEAYVKARGTGLAGELAAITVPLAPDDSSALLHSDEEDLSHWRLESLAPAPGYAGALVGEGRKWTACYWEYVCQATLQRAGAEQPDN